MILGLGIMANSLIFVLVIVPVLVLFYQAIVRAEEHFLRNKFGDAYCAYQRDVNRWIPNLSGIGRTLQGMTFRWRRAVLTTVSSTKKALCVKYLSPVTHPKGTYQPQYCCAFCITYTALCSTNFSS